MFKVQLNLFYNNALVTCKFEVCFKYLYIIPTEPPTLIASGWSAVVFGKTFCNYNPLPTEPPTLIASGWSAVHGFWENILQL
jgi:hypothetical protein